MSYPTALNVAEDLLVAINNFRTSLVTGIGTTDTSITLQSVTGLQTTNGLVSIDTEIVGYAAINTSGSNPVLVGCTRGIDGTSSATHAAGAAVEIRWVAAHHNRLALLLLAVEGALGPVPATDSLNGQAFSSLADRLNSTLPAVITAASSTDWSFNHNRKRIVGIQCWKRVASVYQPVIPTVLNQQLNPAGAATVTIQFTAAVDGYIVVT